MFGTIWRYHQARFHRYFSHHSIPRIITASLFVAVFLCLAFGIYAFFRASFIFIGSDAYAHQALLLYVYEMFLLMVGSLVFISALISGLFGLFAGGSAAWLMVSPRYRVMPLNAAANIFEAAAWPFFLVAVPALVAVRNVIGLSWLGLAIGTLAVLFLVAFCVLSAIVLLLVLSYLLRGLTRLTRAPFLRSGWLIFLTGTILALGAWVIYGRLSGTDVVDLFQSPAGALTAGLEHIIIQFSVFPTHAVAMTLFSLGQGNMATGVSSFLTIVILVAILFIVMSALVRPYLPLWQAFQEGQFQAARQGPRQVSGPIRFPRYLSGPVGALFEKEALTLRRQPRSVLWLGFMLALWLTQTLLNIFIRSSMLRHQASPNAVGHLLEALHVLIAVYFMSAMSLRFVFPAFSSERRTAWILASAPIDLARVYRTKLAFFSIFFVVLGGILIGVNTVILNTTISDFWPFLATTMLAILFVTAFALALGAWFPNFETDDPEQLSTSMPGLGFTAAALTYGAAGAYALFALLEQGSYLYFGLFVIVSLVGLVVFFRGPQRSLGHLEFGVGE